MFFVLLSYLTHLPVLCNHCWCDVGHVVMGYIDMPPHWLDGSLRAMRTMRSKHAAHTGGVEIPASLEEMVYNMQFSDDHSLDASSLPVLQAPVASTHSKDHHYRSKFENMPDSYYESMNHMKHTPPVQRIGSIPLSKSHSGLLKSPFGNPRKILERTLSSKVVVPSKSTSAEGKERRKEVASTDISVTRKKGSTVPSREDIEDLEYPKVVKKHAIVAERLFGSDGGNGAHDDTCNESALDKLSYEEKLTVMLMQVKGEMA